MIKVRNFLWVNEVPIMTAAVLIIAAATVVMAVSLVTESCVRGQFIVASPTHGLVVVGDQGICGRGLRWTTVEGPSKIQGGVVQ